MLILSHCWCQSTLTHQATLRLNEGLLPPNSAASQTFARSCHDLRQVYHFHDGQNFGAHANEVDLEGLGGCWHHIFVEANARKALVIYAVPDGVVASVVKSGVGAHASSQLVFGRLQIPLPGEHSAD